MSPRAACRLEAMGFTAVYDYVPGKVDWLAHGLPTEGHDADKPRAGQVIRDDVATCTPQTPAHAVLQAIDASPYGFALVLSVGRLVLGRVRRSALAGEMAATAWASAEPGPPTVRPSVAQRRLADDMTRAGRSTAVVTTPEGRLLGVVRRDDLPPPSA